MKKILLIAVLVSLAADPSAARQRPTDDPGYVDPATVEALFDKEATLEVNLSGSLLRMVAEAAREEDGSLYALLSKIKGIYVRGYTLSDADVDRVAPKFGDITGRLSGSGLERIVRVRESDQDVTVLVRVLSDHIDGMAVFVASPGENETVFVNIVGEIRPEEIGRIGRRFSIRALEDL